MGTVGLNFGSPTSGAGFDVSATVAEIVGNLKNVETPWKNQLTKLESQDTTISSLGTLFSNLSNDMSSLTKLNGIMAQKMGSSSDPNVLTLTAANNTAVAGTHTVSVTNLAQTSSGYLAPVTSATAKLSGSVTLQVGNGTAQTITISSSDNTLAGLASAINSSGVGVTASVLTDSSGSRLSLVSGTSGANGNLTISSNSITASNTTLNYSGSVGTSQHNSTGTLTSITNAGDALTGNLSVQVGNGTTENVVIGAVPSGGAAPNTIYTGSGVNTLSGLASAITSAGLGFTASVVTNSDGSSSLSLLSGTPGLAGTMTVASHVVDTSNSLGYTSTVNGMDAQLTVDGVNLTSSSNMVANLIPGITFQLLGLSATQSDNSLEQVQVVIGNDNSGVESTVRQMVNDYNSLISAINTQEGNDSSGNPEPLFGSPTLSLLQQQLLGGLNMTSPNGSLASIATNTDTTLTGSMTISVGGGATENIVFGAGTSTAHTFYTGSGVNTLSGLASAINAGNFGATARVVTLNNQSTLVLTSQTAGTNGALAVTSNIVATSDTLLSYAGAPATFTQNAIGTLGSVPSTSDALTGSISIQVGSGAAQTVNVPPASATSPTNDLSGLADAINAANIGVTASVITNGNGTSSLSILSNTAGSAGNLTVTSSILDTTNTKTTTLDYSNSSDINNLTSLGIDVNSDGSLTFDAASLDSVLNSDFSSVSGFFQNANSWGRSFSSMLTSSGTASVTGILALTAKSNSSIEATLNADISKEESLISAQQKTLTAELNTANQILQSIPTLLDQVNELYSAITGYNQNK